MAGGDLSVRTYRPGDEHEIQAAYETVFGRKRSLAEWRWRFQEAPAGPAAIHVAEVDGAFAGHIAHMPMPTWVDGHRMLLGQGGDSMTLDAFRGRGVLRRLVETVLAEDRFDLRMNFPSEMARPLFVRYGAGEVIGDMPVWIRRHALSRKLPRPAAYPARGVLAAARLAADHPRPRIAVEPLVELGAEVDELAEASASYARCIRARDAAYLRWRWLEQPDARWEIRAARARDGRLLGISVLGVEEGARGRTGWINDLLAPDPGTLRALLLDGAERLARRGAHVVCCQYLDPRPWSRRVLVRCGFLRSRTDFPIVARSLAPAAGGAPERLSSWYLTRSDTEPWPSLTEG